MIILDRALERREADGNPIRVAIVGAGYMARGIAAQASSTIGMEVVAISNRTLDTAVRLFEEIAGGDVTQAHSPQELETAMSSGIPVVANDPSVLCRADGVDVVIETTGEVEFGAGVVLDALTARKHVVLVNAELDATVGPILKQKADAAGVILTNTDGDEPGVAMNLLRYVRTIGLRPVLTGNIKGFIDPHRTPETQAAFAESVGQRPKMITSFADGTKLSMEATIVANATGFRVARRGMKGTACGHVNDVLEAFDPAELLSGGLVDYVLGAAPGSGAFVVGYGVDPIPQQYLRYFKMGDGPFYVFYTPWHLPHAEAPLTAARAVLFQDAAVTPLGPPSCDVIAMAKRDLRAGEVLDGIGGYTCYGVIENADVAQRKRLLPMGLSEGCELLADVKADAPLAYSDVRTPEGRLVDKLRAEQDRVLAR